MNGAGALIDSVGQAGHRLTTPRRLVAELVAAREGHFTAADLVADARRQRRAIGRASVFRALELFTELGLVERVDLPTGDHAYVACQAVHHHHAICTRCGRSFDVSEVGLGPVLADIAQRLDFQVTTHRLEVFGVCAACRDAATS